VKFNDAFYNGFRSEVEELQKEGWVTAALALAPAALKAGKSIVKGIGGAAKRGARATGRGAKSVAGRAAGYVPFMGSGGGKSKGQGSTYV